MLEAVVAEFLANPVGFIFGGGGVLGLFVLAARWWRNRARVRAVFLGETCNANVGYEGTVEVRFEIENLGREATSLLPEVSLTCRYPRSRTLKHSLTVQEAERTLAPVTPYTFTFRGSLPSGYLFSHFRVFTIKFTRGPSVRIRILNAFGQSAGWLRFSVLKALYIVFGALPHVQG